MLFFSSLNLPITSYGSLLPVAFLQIAMIDQRIHLAILAVVTHCASGVSSRMKTFHFFSSPIVDLPVVHESCAAREARLWQRSISDIHEDARNTQRNERAVCQQGDQDGMSGYPTL